VRARILSVIGGLRLLARMDQSPASGQASPVDKAPRLN
jgi:hypothetical protein